MDKAILKKRRTGEQEERVNMKKHVRNELYIPRKAGTGRRSVSVLDSNSCDHDIRILAFSACCGWHYHIRKIVNNVVARVISKRWLAEWLALSKHLKLLVMR